MDRTPRIPEHALQAFTHQVETMVAESGNPKGFNAQEWLQVWLEQPCPALGNRPPAELLDTEEGQATISGLLAQMQTGAFA